MDKKDENENKVSRVRHQKHADGMPNSAGLFEPRREKTGFLHMRKQRRRSASRSPRS